MAGESTKESAVMEVVCAALCNEAGEVLVCQRPEGKSLAGKWEFPGGKVEEGESFEAALHREMQEELDCCVLVHRTLTPVVHDYGDFSIRLRPYLCSLAGACVTALEHAAIQWVAVADLLQIDLADADRAIASELGCL